MGELADRFRNATLRSYDEVTATITELDYREATRHDATATIHVTYQIGTGDGETITEVETFDLPTENDPTYAFVRLCRTVDVPLPDAATELVGCVVEVTTDGEEWALDLPDEPAFESDSDSVTGDEDEEETTGSTDERYDPNAAPPIRTQLRQWAATPRPMKLAAYIATILVLPIVLVPLATEVHADDVDENPGDALFNAVLIFCGGLLLYCSGVVVVLWIVRNVIV